MHELCPVQYSATLLYPVSKVGYLVGISVGWLVCGARVGSAVVLLIGWSVGTVVGSYVGSAVVGSALTVGFLVGRLG